MYSFPRQNIFPFLTFHKSIHIPCSFCLCTSYFFAGYTIAFIPERFVQQGPPQVSPEVLEDDKWWWPSLTELPEQMFHLTNHKALLLGVTMAPVVIRLGVSWELVWWFQPLWDPAQCLEHRRNPTNGVGWMDDLIPSDCSQPSLIMIFGTSILYLIYYSSLDTF